MLSALWEHLIMVSWYDNIAVYNCSHAMGLFITCSDNVWSTFCVVCPYFVFKMHTCKMCALKKCKYEPNTSSQKSILFIIRVKIISFILSLFYVFKSNLYTKFLQKYGQHMLIKNLYFNCRQNINCHISVWSFYGIFSYFSTESLKI